MFVERSWAMTGVVLFGDTAKMITGVHRLVDGGYTIH